MSNAAARIWREQVLMALKYAQEVGSYRHRGHDTIYVSREEYDAASGDVQQWLRNRYRRQFGKDMQ